MATTVDELLTTAETAALLRCHRNTLINLANRGVLTPIRASARRNLYRRTDLEQFLNTARADDASIVHSALALLAESHAADQRALCPSCGKRRVDRGNDRCPWCKQQDEAQLLYKRTWWDQHGADQRAQRRQDTA